MTKSSEGNVDSADNIYRPVSNKDELGERSDDKNVNIEKRNNNNSDMNAVIKENRDINVHANDISTVAAEVMKNHKLQ